jgi:hypothetical protein
MNMLTSKERTWLKKAHPGIIIGLKGLESPVADYEESAVAGDVRPKHA